MPTIPSTWNRERDACGVGFVADRRGRRSHDVLNRALGAVSAMAHRGAVAADARTGDGAGVLTHIPYTLLRRDLRLKVPNAGLAAGMVFLPQETDPARRARVLITAACKQAGMRVLGWRQVPVDPSALGDHARRTMPDIAQVVILRPEGLDDDVFERALYRLRRVIEKRAAAERLSLYLPSLSHATMVYKGLLVSPQLPRFFPDLTDPGFETAIAVFHQRYSTNTSPSWPLAQPFRLLAHNGEINTLQGNVAWMASREAGLRSPLWPHGVDDLLPIIQRGGSDSAMLDNVLELLTRSGRDLLHATLMLVPSAWEGIADLPAAVAAFFEYHGCLVEAWDGPAALAFSDGRFAAAALDRNGLRPARYVITDDGLVAVASEAGVIDLAPERIVEKGRLGPGQILAVDTYKGAVLHDGEIKGLCAMRHPYEDWVERHMVRLTDVHAPAEWVVPANLVIQQRVFGFAAEDIDRVLRSMVEDRKDPVFSMGDDTPLAALATRPRTLAHYFRQRFAQVTNPPIDPLRERLVMSLGGYLGPQQSLLEEDPTHARLLHVPSPVLTGEMMGAIRTRAPVPTATLSVLWSPGEGPMKMQRALDALIEQACGAVAGGVGILVLTDQGVARDRAPIPMLLAVSAVHHALIRRGLRYRTGLVVEAGEARDIHSIACLIGYGASAVHAYLALQTITAESVDAHDARGRIEAWRQAVEDGLLKIISKMGISTLSAYHGAQIFEVVGLSQKLINEHFAGTPAHLGGMDLEEIARMTLERHAQAYRAEGPLEEAGVVRFRRNGEYHAFNPYVVKAMRQAVRDDGEGHRRLDTLVSERPATEVRDLLEFVPANPVPLAEVEPASQIVKRFVVSAMSHGALSREAHETLAIAANRIGARSNSGEGGEDAVRYPRRADGDWPNSTIKQIASARFGVTPAYVLSAGELEIKMAQGSKPGEGGQLPGHKVSEEIARIRRSQPGITLISPPPHHDIYSIEDLSQLIYDLKNLHPQARVAVKLVAEAGVGTIAAGVAKGFADTIQISGHAGGTGASPLDSIKHAGVPWEIGLAETQQVLVENGLRGRVRLRVDGGLKIARDIVIAAMLGADEFGFGSAAVVALGCVMTRECHLNTCPVGIATQRVELRRKFPGKPENVTGYLTGLAEEIRRLLAALGVRCLDEIIGRAERLRPKAGAHGGVDVGSLLPPAADTNGAPDRARRCTMERNERPEVSFDTSHLLPLLSEIEAGQQVERLMEIRNTDRAVGTRLAGAIAERLGDGGLPEGTVRLHFTGTAGQSFGAFLLPGIHLRLVGEANDYVGKSMHGGEIAITPPAALLMASHRHVIAGNTLLYGATGGRLFAAGRVGERFAVRNSGAVAVVEGVGDHGCEYMTGGTMVVLGEVGRNFGAGMTGGEAFVYDESGTLPLRYNTQLVTITRLTPDDAARLRDLIIDHGRATGSSRARMLLGNWEAHTPRFWKVAPRAAVKSAPPQDQRAAAVGESAIVSA